MLLAAGYPLYEHLNDARLLDQQRAEDVEVARQRRQAARAARHPTAWTPCYFLLREMAFGNDADFTQGWSRASTQTSQQPQQPRQPHARRRYRSTSPERCSRSIRGRPGTASSPEPSCAHVPTSTRVNALAFHRPRGRLARARCRELVHIRRDGAVHAAKDPRASCRARVGAILHNCLGRCGLAAQLLAPFMPDAERLRGARSRRECLQGSRSSWGGAFPTSTGSGEPVSLPAHRDRVRRSSCGEEPEGKGSAKSAG